MNNIDVSENSLQIDRTKKIIDNILKVDKRYQASKDNLQKLTTDLSRHNTKIAKIEKKTEGKWFSNAPDRKDLFDLIKSDRDSNSQSNSTIGKMISSVNDNTRDLANMIQGLAMISSFTLKKTSENITTTEELHGLLNDNFEGDAEQQSHIKQVIQAHIKRAIEEKERTEIIDLNFIKITDKIGEIESLLIGLDDGINKIIDKRELEFNDKLNTIQEKYEERLKDLSSMWGSETDITLVKNYKKMQRKYKYSNALSIVSIIAIFCFSAFQIFQNMQ
jgi:hypothetical protein